MILTRKPILIGAITTLILAISAVTVTFVVLEYKNDNDVINYVEHGAIVIWGDDDFEDYDFPGRGTESNPYRISEYNITTDSLIGISIWNTKKYFVIENCYINATKIGISIESVAPGSAVISKNICDANPGIGIVIYYSPQTALIGNECNNNGYGIIVDSSSGCILTENTCKNNEIGIIIYYSQLASLTQCVSKNNNLGIYIGYSASTSVSECEVNNNHKGFSVEESAVIRIESSVISHNSYGIILLKSRASIIENNEIEYNYFGIYLEKNSLLYIKNNYFTYNAMGVYFYSNVDTSTITSNYFELNYIYAISIEVNNDINYIYHNTFLNNSAYGSSQAYDDSVNIWYDVDTNTGNYWDDFLGIGSYIIEGIGGNSDPYPLETPPVF